MSKSTEQALIARGIDNSTSRKLAEKGYTIRKLQQESVDNLKRIGLNDGFIRKLQKEKRPPIDAKILNELLHRSAYTCCVCRDKSLPIMVHHLTEWHISKSHEHSNLAVLCLNCHSKAHSKSTISIDLSSENIVFSKETWEQKVKQDEIDAIFNKPSFNIMSGYWDFFNHARILEIIHKLCIDLKQIPNYDLLLINNAINPDGSYIWPTNQEKGDLQFMYQTGVQGSLSIVSIFYADLMREILKKANFVDITNNFRKSAIKLLKINDIVSVTGGHRFRSVTNRNIFGPGQIRKGYRYGNGLRLEFDFDAWEATSSSSHDGHLTGNWRCTSIGIIRSLSSSKKINTINCTCLAIGTGFTDYIGKKPGVAYELSAEEEFM